MFPPSRLVAVAAVSLCALVALPSPASAAKGCDGQPTSRPFLPWADLASYVTAPGGDFESGAAGWRLSGGAALASGNETYYVSSTADTTSLSLPRSSSATSPAFCADLAHPTVRLFAKGGGLLSSLDVEVLYTDRAGVLRSQALGQVTPSSSWQPTLPLLTLTGLPMLTGSRIALRFKAVGGAFSIDDVYVDPFSRT